MVASATTADRLAARRSTRLAMGALLQVFQAELLGFLVVAEQLGVAAPGDGSAQGLGRVFGGHVVLQLVAEANGGGAVVPAFVQHLPDLRNQRNVSAQRLRELRLAVIGVALG